MTTNSNKQYYVPPGFIIFYNKMYDHDKSPAMVNIALLASIEISDDNVSFTTSGIDASSAYRYRLSLDNYNKAIARLNMTMPTVVELPDMNNAEGDSRSMPVTYVSIEDIELMEFPTAPFEENPALLKEIADKMGTAYVESGRFWDDLMEIAGEITSRETFPR